MAGLRANFVIINKDSSLSSWYKSRFSNIFFPLLSQSRHYSHYIASFFDEHHRLPPYNFFFFFRRKPQLILVSSIHKPKTEVTGHSEVELVETIIPVCPRPLVADPRPLTAPRQPVNFATSSRSLCHFSR